MRACAILLESMVLSLWMSSGRTMPATISSRISKLTRISCLPSTTRLPFGSTCVTTAATLVCSASWRLTEPLPSLEAVESAVRMRPGNMLFPVTPSVLLPTKSVMPESSLLVRLRWVSLAILALSVMLTVTVRRSPTRAARWSLQKAREPFRHSELALYDTVSGFGTGICPGLLPVCVVGFSIAFNFGCSLICDNRLIDEHPLATLRIASDTVVRAKRLLDLHMGLHMNLDMNFTRFLGRLADCCW